MRQNLQHTGTLELVNHRMASRASVLRDSVQTLAKVADVRLKHIHVAKCIDRELSSRVWSTTENRHTRYMYVDLPNFVPFVGGSHPSRDWLLTVGSTRRLKT